MSTEPEISPVPDAEALDFVQDLAAFIQASPSSFHAVAESARRLREAGFEELDELDAWPQVHGRRFVVRDGSIVAWVAPEEAGPTTACRIFGAHTDSPALKLKPKSTTSAHGWLQAGVEIYGGPLINSWLDRELELAGRLVTADGRSHLTRTGPLLRIPQLAPHLDRSVNDSLHLERQRHLNPIWGLGIAKDADLLGVLAAGAGIDPGEVGGYDIVAAPAEAPQVFGGSGELFAAPRLDNLLSTHAGLSALIAAPGTSGPIMVFAAFDHEEIGSTSRSGADGSFLEDTLVRLYDALGADATDRLRAWAGSLLVSCDVGHSVNPNYPEKHDPVVRPLAGRGPMLKINANQRYATDAVGAAAWTGFCAAADVPSQEFVSNNDSPCGSTIGPMSAARLGIRTVDVGVAILSMHSARELCAVVDPWFLARAVAELYRG